jgi:multidrug efflux pump
MAFFEGSTGAIYRQFPVTVVSAMILSVFVALSLSPALCATILKEGEEPHAKTGLFGLFNRNFDRLSKGYSRWVAGILNRRKIFMIFYACLVAGMAFLFFRVPTSFLPDEDQGRMFVMISLPPGATQQRTLDVVKQVEDYFLDKEKENVKSMFGIVGFSFAGHGQNAGFAFIELKDWSLRKRPDQSAQAIAGRAFMALSGIRDAQIFPIVPPSVPALGNASGFDMQLVDRGGEGHAALIKARNQLLGMAAQNPKLMGVRPNGLEDTPQYKIDINQEKAMALGLSISDINATLQQAWSPTYVNDFIENGRVKRVFMEGDAPFRMLPSDIDKWYVRNATGQMIPFSSFSTAHWTYGSPKLERFNGVSSVNIQGSPAPGVSSGEAMKIMESLVSKLPKGFGLEWTGLSYEEIQAGSQAPLLYALSLTVVFLCLAALYESWSIPLSVMLVVPLGVLGAVLAIYLRGLSNDVYFQVGLLLTMGLAAKNAILIVEFAKKLREEEGLSIIDAALQASHIRLRPILMTSLAFIFGVMPLAVASGAGSGAENAIGTGVIGGMLSATIFTIFFAPLFFALVYTFTGRRNKTADQP